MKEHNVPSSTDDNLPNDSVPPATVSAGHVPVLAAEILHYFSPKPGETMVDCTLGRGGHALLIAPLLGPAGCYLGLDVDPANLQFAQNRLQSNSANVTCIQANFQQLRQALDELGINRINLLLADLGFSSNQMDDPQRGFSFQQDGPLDMRLNPGLPSSAADLVNRLPERELADLIYQYGEERLSRRIARNIVANRHRSPILTTAQLAQIVRHAYGPAGRHQRIDPATRTFMALRIAVNDELDALDRLLESLPGILAPGARAGIISFHSLEDRRVKQAWQKYRASNMAEILTKKPVIAGPEECELNPRSRSAKLRVMLWKGSGKQTNSG